MTTVVGPGASWDAAYQAAQAGDVIRVLLGPHGKQTLNPRRNGALAGPVSFIADPGATVDLLDIESASWLKFIDQRIRRFFVVGAAKEIDFVHCEVGGTPEAPQFGQCQIKKYNQSDPAAPSRVRINACEFHDFRRKDVSVHTEGLQILNGAALGLFNSRFWNCDGTGDLGVTPMSLIDGLTIEDCVFNGGGDTGFGIQFGGLIRDLVCRRNSGDGDVFFSDSEVVGPYLFEANSWREGYSLRHSPAGRIASFIEAPPPPPPPPVDPRDQEIADLQAKLVVAQEMLAAANVELDAVEGRLDSAASIRDQVLQLLGTMPV